MRRKVVASILALISCALMVLPQAGMTVRDAAMGQQTVIKSPAESSGQQSLEAQEGEDQGNSAPAESGEESPADTPTPTEGTQAHRRMPLLMIKRPMRTRQRRRRRQGRDLL